MSSAARFAPRSGRLAGMRLGMVMRVGKVEGLAGGRDCWAAGQIGERTTPVNGSAKDR